jgi:hypothetical protein
MVILRTSVISDAQPDTPITTPHQPGVVEKFELQEGVVQEETIHFRAKTKLVNLRRRMTTWKMGVQVDQREAEMGTFEGDDTEHSFTFPTSPVPKGWHVRGEYKLLVEFIDDAGSACASISKQFTIVKEKKKSPGASP